METRFKIAAQINDDLKLLACTPSKSPGCGEMNCLQNLLRNNLSLPKAHCSGQIKYF